MFQKIRRWLKRLMKQDKRGTRYSVLSRDCQNPGVRRVHGHRTKYYKKACGYAKRLARGSSMDVTYWVEDDKHKVLATYQGRRLS